MGDVIKHYDIAIIGGGLAGASLANALLGHGFSVAVIDKGPAPKQAVENQDSRAIALSYSSLQCLKTMGVWPLFSEDAEPIMDVQISVQGSFGVTRINAQQCGLEMLGAVINADALNFGLNVCLMRSESADILDIYRNHSLRGLKRIEDGWELDCTPSKTIQATLLVGADGSDSYLRQQLGIGMARTQSLESAITTNIYHSEPHLGTAFERFTNTGSIAMLPFGDGRSKCVSIVPTRELGSFLHCEDRVFLQHLQTEFGFRLGHLQHCSQRVSYALQPSHVENIYGLGWVLIGNAANTLSPIAAQGFNLALRDVALLAELLIQKKRNKALVGDISVLQEFADCRVHDQQRVRQFTENLSQNGSDINHSFKTLGLLACELIPSVRQWVTEMGLGKHSPLPKLSRGVPA